MRITAERFLPPARAADYLRRDRNFRRLLADRRRLGGGCTIEVDGPGPGAGADAGRRPGAR